ncbi:MAG TPA: amidohydrolase family protein [Blastocatellia bacterium]|nr:amidohydrolase family protein [Blastocatellia bacterium]
MASASTALSLLLVLSILPAAQMRYQPPPTPASKLIKAGRLLDVKSGRYLLEQGILTEGEKIKAIGPWEDIRTRAANEVTLIDLSNATLLPGLIDCHAHLLISGDLGRLDPGELLVTTLAQMSVSSRALLGARNARETLEAGVTSARIVGHSGVDGDVALRDAINAGWIPGPRLQAAARKITALGPINVQPGIAAQVLGQEFLAVSGPEQARAAVRENLANGADLIKISIDSDGPRNWKTRYLSIDDAKAIVEDAHRLGMKVAAHAADNIAVQIAIDAGVDSIEHAWSATDAQLNQMKERGIFLVATEIFVAAPPKDRLQRAMRIGVRIAMGSDAWASLPGKTRGEATLLDLKKLQDEGMPALDIIRSATLNAAELMGWSDRVGQLTEGAFADIIAVTGDPLQDTALLQHAEFVMKGATVVRNGFAKSQLPPSR